jgi:hypothetical protein
VLLPAEHRFSHERCGLFFDLLDLGYFWGDLQIFTELLCDASSEGWLLRLLVVDPVAKRCCVYAKMRYFDQACICNSSRLA